MYEQLVKEMVKSYELKQNKDIAIEEVKVVINGKSNVVADVLCSGGVDNKAWAGNITYSMKDLIEAYSETHPTIFAFDLSRVYKWFGDKSFAVISAYLSSKSEEENVANQNELKKLIREKGYGYKEMRGAWRDNGNADSPITYEYSLFIPEMTPQDAIDLGKRFNQQAVLYGDGKQIVLDFMGNGQNMTFDTMKTQFDEGWTTWSENKRNSEKKYTFASVVWEMPMPIIPTSWITALVTQKFLEKGTCTDFSE
jgi:hypothetical protein